MSESTRPRPFVDVFRAVYRGLVRGAAPLAVYEILAKSLAAGVLGPLSAGLLAMLISFSGSVAVSNEQILSFALSPLGIASLGLSVSLGFLITFLEEAGLVSIASTTYSGEPV
ncbi:MAG: hypothetical protein HQ582_11710, partial [Planctomycetes bacterium]|nr:hypothetical protein [Planctomycetota bacterium]